MAQNTHPFPLEVEMVVKNGSRELPPPYWDNNSRVGLITPLSKGPNDLVPLLECLVGWRSYKHTIVWNLEKAYTTVHSGLLELHLRRLVWRNGKTNKYFTLYSFKVCILGINLLCLP